MTNSVIVLIRLSHAALHEESGDYQGDQRSHELQDLPNLSSLQLKHTDLKLRVSGCTLLGDPVRQRCHALTVDIGILRGAGAANHDLLLYTVGGQGALALEHTRGDVLVACAFGQESDVDASDVGAGVPLACDELVLRDAVLRGLHGGHERAEAVDLHGVALREELDDTARHLLEHAADYVVAVDGVVVGHVFRQTVE